MNGAAPSAEGSRRPAGEILRSRAGDPAAITVFDLAYGAIGAAAAAVAVPAGLLRSRRDPEQRRRLLGRLALDLAVEPASAIEDRVVLHGVSVGEVRLVAPLLRALRDSGETVRELLTATTATGLQEARRRHQESPVRPFPIDFPTCAARFLDRLRPRSVLLLELELWPGFLRHAAKRQVPIAVVNGRISERTARRYGWLREYAARRLGDVRLFAVQGEAHAERLLALGVPPDRIAVCGNMKFDGLADPAKPPDAEIAARLRIDANDVLVVAGSTHAPEEDRIADAVARLRASGFPGLRIAVVPRHLDRIEEVVALLSRRLGRVERLSVLRSENRSVTSPTAPIVVDTVGDLEALYRFARIAFVGGSLENRRGGQNVLEPAALGVPVVHGPGMESFAEAAAILSEAGASRVVRNGDELAEALGRWLGDPDGARRAGAGGPRAVAPHRGAAARVVRELRARGLP